MLNENDKRMIDLTITHHGDDFWNKEANKDWVIQELEEILAKEGLGLELVKIEEDIYFADLKPGNKFRFEYNGPVYFKLPSLAGYIELNNEGGETGEIKNHYGPSNIVFIVE